ncbi:MAG: DUF4917 family protein [Chlorobiaceae bacterium]|nr:DUF4917 family protein [Chlorobiaceae bacterium]
MTIMTFAEAIEASACYSKRHLLLGNGFSIACRPDIFRYDKLFEQADFSTLPDSAKSAFSVLHTTDFERVIKVLRDSASIAAGYGVTSTQADAMRSDADELKELLVETIAQSHPALPGDITDDEYAACQRFLDNFTTTYTFNYDLLLYWTHMHRENRTDIHSDDGFRTSQSDIDSGIDSEYVVWESSQSHDQNMWFLHGALHVFDSGTEIQKYTWNRTGVRLIEQIREALSRNFFPLFVAEGSSAEKLERVRHSDYLAKAYRSFQEIQKCLFIYGHSLAANDEHYLRLIEKGKLSHIFVGLYGDPASATNKMIAQRANAMRLARTGKRELIVDFYDSESAHVWR